ncbi:MAG: hypothetical protein ACKOOL_02225 [Novosphingobium sp.]
MEFGDVVGLLIAMGGLVGIFGIMGVAYRRRLEHKERIAEIKANGVAAPALPEKSDYVAKLEHRIRVLERIATDKTANLATQIEDLRTPVN